MNCDLKVTGNILTITVDLDKAPLTPSASGKTRMVATTQGNVKVPNDKLAGLTVGLNVYVPANR